jgi:hypothetical protein
MQQVKSAVLGVLRFLGVSLLISLGFFVLVSLSCLIGPRCSNVAYSERMFWVGLVAMLGAMPAVLASLGSNQGYYDNPLTAGINAQVALTIAKDNQRSLSKRSTFALRSASVGLMCIGASALIDILGSA